jgi:hypothetical protein
VGKKTPKAPVAPDPVATANAQKALNQSTAVSEAYLNRADQYTPEGSLTWNVVGTNPDGTPKFASTQTYSPGQQALYDKQNQVSNALSDTAMASMGNVNRTMSTPWDTSGFQPIQYGGGNAGNIQTGYNTGGNQQYGFDAGGNIQQNYASGGNIQNTYASGGDIARGYDVGGNIQDSYASGGDIQRGYASGGDIQKGLDYSGLDKIPGIGDYGAEAQRVQDSVYKQATSRLDPQWEQQQRQLAATLAAKGVSENSVAYRNAMDQAQRQKTDAYNQATYSGIQAGSQEQSRLFGLALQGRQEGVGEINYQGQFANSAQAQAEAQNAARAGFGNSAQAQAEAQNAARAGFGNSAQQQRNQQNMQQAQFGNTAQSQAEAQNAARAGFGNEAQAQSETQNAARAAFGNEAQNQQYTQNMGQAAFYNQAQGAQNQQNAAQAAFGNTAQNQQYNQNMSSAAFNNQARQQQEQSAAYARSLPIQEMASLMSGSQVQAPQFANYNQPNVQNTDYSGLVQNQYNNQMQQYNQQMASRNAGIGSIFGLAGSALSAIPFSDRRLKHHIEQVGELASGIKIYVFSYLGSVKREFGFMADDILKVLPEAVGSRDGFMTVDHGKVWQHG